MTKWNDTPYGTLLTADDGTCWYTCGSWRMVGEVSGVPAILAYVPEGSRFRRLPGQKAVDRHGVTLLKTSNRPLEEYTAVHLAAVSDLIAPRCFGRLAFLQEQRIVEIRQPGPFAARFVAEVAPEGPLVADLCHRLGLEISGIGIWGSALLFDPPVRRHETDVVIYGREASERAHRNLTRPDVDLELFEMEQHLGVCAAFRYRGCVFDLFYDRGSTAIHELHGAQMEIVGREPQVEVTIADATEALYYPASYITSDGTRLLSFRPAHARRFFRQGTRLRFPSLSRVLITRVSGHVEEAHAVLDYETAEFLGSSTPGL
jgi:predicted nucleotidyltransferase